MRFKATEKIVFPIESSETNFAAFVTLVLL